MALCDSDVLLFVCLFVRLSSVFPDAVEGSFFLMQFGVRRAGAFRVVFNTPVTHESKYNRHANHD